MFSPGIRIERKTADEVFPHSNARSGLLDDLLNGLSRRSTAMINERRAK